MGVGCGDSGVEIRCLGRTDDARYLLGGSGEALPCVSVKRLRSGRVGSGYSSGFIKTWHADTGELVLEVGQAGDEVAALDETADGSKLVAAYKAKGLQLLDSRTLQPHQTIDCTVTANAKLFAVRAHPTEFSLCIAAGWNGVTKVVDMRVPRVVRELDTGMICGDALDIEGFTLLAASWVQNPATAISLWDLRYASSPVRHVDAGRADTGAYLYAGRLRRGRIVIGGSGIREGRVYDVASGRQLARLPCYIPSEQANPYTIQALDCSPDGSTVVIGTSHSFVSVFALPRLTD